MPSETPSPSSPQPPAAAGGPLPDTWSPPAFCHCISWSGVLGNFLLAFGSLDHFITSFLKDRLQPREFSKLRESGFKDKFDRMAELIPETGATPGEIKRFKRLRRCVDGIRSLRNHVARAHLFGTINPDTDEPVITLFSAKDADLESLEESRHVTFSELVKTHNDLQALLKDFEVLAGYKPGFDFELA